MPPAGAASAAARVMRLSRMPSTSCTCVQPGASSGSSQRGGCCRAYVGVVRWPCCSASGALGAQAAARAPARTSGLYVHACCSAAAKSKLRSNRHSRGRASVAARPMTPSANRLLRALMASLRACGALPHCTLNVARGERTHAAAPALPRGRHPPQPLVQLAGHGLGRAAARAPDDGHHAQRHAHAEQAVHDLADRGLRRRREARGRLPRALHAQLQAACGLRPAACPAHRPTSICVSRAAGSFSST